MKRCAEDAGSTGGCRLGQLLQRRPLLSNNHLYYEIVLNAHTVLAVHGAERLERDVARRVELDVDLATLKVGLPASFDFFIGNGANVLVQYTFALATDLGDVLGARWSDKLLRLLDAPVKLSKPPPCLGIFLVLDNTGQAHLNGKVANGMDNWRQLDRRCQVCWREYADRLLLIAGKDGALDVNATPVGDLIAIGCGSDCGEIVVQCGEVTMGCGWQMTWQQMAEWIAVRAVAQGCRMRQEFPFVDLGSLRAAVSAVLCDWFPSGDDGEEAHFEFVDGDVGLVYVHHELPRENGTRRRLGAMVEDDWRRLDAHIQGSSRLRVHFGTGLWALLVRVMFVMSLKDIHDERFLRP